MFQIPFHFIMKVNASGMVWLFFYFETIHTHVFL